MVSIPILKPSNNSLVVCPPIPLIEPCQCGFYGQIGAINLFCTGRNLNDAEVSRILNVFLSHPNVSALGKVSLGHNRLTRVPMQFRRFPQLDHVDLDYNNITFIQSGAFQFTKTLQKLSLKSNSLTEIDAGAFQGILSLKQFH